MGRAMREIRTLRATWRGLETLCGSGPRATPARQPSTLLMSGDGKRGDGQRPKPPRPSSTLPSTDVRGSGLLQCKLSVERHPATAAYCQMERTANYKSKRNSKGWNEPGQLC